MKEPRIVRVSVFASASLDEARLAVMDLLVQLNHTFVPRGVEFVLADTSDDVTCEDLAVALYWRDFGNLPKSKFETAYESLKAGGTPTKIYVFFRESAEELDEAMRAFKDSFASKYGHFYCHFEHVDSVRFQLATQCLAYLPNRVDSLISLDEGGKVSLFGEHIADIENLPFAKLNSKRKSLKRQIAAVENEVTNLEEESASEPDDEDLKDSLREARVKRHDLKEELKQYDGFLFSTALFFAKESAKEMDERVQKARELFEQGKVQAANRVLDLSELCESADRNLSMFKAHREACEKDIQAFIAKAEIVLVDDSMRMSVRVSEACKAYDNAIKVAEEVHWEETQLVLVLFNYASLLQDQHRFLESIRSYRKALDIYRRLASMSSKMYAPGVADTLNNLALLNRDLQRLVDAECEFNEALGIYRRLALMNPEVYEPQMARTLNNMGLLHMIVQRFEDAESEIEGALEIFRRFASLNASKYEQYLATSLNSLGMLHSLMLRNADAEMEFGEALTIYRHLLSERPESYVYESSVATALNSLAILHSDMHRIADAEMEFGEALEIYRRLSSANPDAYEQHVAMTLNNMGDMYKDCGQLEDAEAEYEEALVIYRRLASLALDAYEPYVAATLNNLGDLHRETQRLSDAEVEYEEALEIRRRLAIKNPKVYEPYVATTLVDLTYLLDGMNDREEDVITMAQEAIGLLRKYELYAPRQFTNELTEEISVLAKWLKEREDSET